MMCAFCIGCIIGQSDVTQPCISVVMSMYLQTRQATCCQPNVTTFKRPPQVADKLCDRLLRHDAYSNSITSHHCSKVNCSIDIRHGLLCRAMLHDCSNARICRKDHVWLCCYTSCSPQLLHSKALLSNSCMHCLSCLQSDWRLIALKSAFLHVIMRHLPTKLT